MIGIPVANGDDSCNSNEGICSYTPDKDLKEKNWRSSKLIKILACNGHCTVWNQQTETRNYNDEYAVRPARMCLSEAEQDKKFVNNKNANSQGQYYCQT